MRAKICLVDPRAEFCLLATILLALSPSQRPWMLKRTEGAQQLAGSVHTVPGERRDSSSNVAQNRSSWLMVIALTVLNNQGLWLEWVLARHKKSCQQPYNPLCHI